MGLQYLRWAGLSTVLGIGLAVSACGSPAGSKPAAQVVPELQNAASVATSVHVAGSVINGKQTTTIDVTINGDSVAGYLGAYGTRFYVLSINGQNFVKVNAAFLNVEKAPASLCAAICGKYVELPAASGTQITNLLSMEQLNKEIFDTSTMNAVATSGCVFSPAVRAGQPVLECSQGSDRLVVTARGQPYLIFWSGPDGQHLAFSDWNTAALPAAPPASQVVSLSSLG